MAVQGYGVKKWLCLGLAAAMTILMAMDADAAERKAKRILLAGDSWPFFMWTGGMHGIYFWQGCAAQDGLDEAGYADWQVWGGDTAVPMSMAREWRDNVPQSYKGRVVGRLDILRMELESNPNIDIVHLSLGGNDVGRGYFNDVMPQQIRFLGAPTGGTFVLRFNGQQTAPLPYNATAAQIQSAMEALSTVGAGRIEVTGPDGGPYMCVFDPALVAYVYNGPDNNISVSSSLTGGSVVVDEAHHGWEKSWGTDSAYEKLFFQALCDAIEKVIRQALDVRPDIRVALCDYDYLRVDWGGATELETRYAGMRLGMAKFELTQRLSAMPQYRNRCFYIAPGGLMQYVFGLYSRYKYCAVGVGDVMNPCTDSGPAPGAILLYGPNGTPGAAGTVARPLSNLVKHGITQPIPGGDIDPPVDYYPDDRPDPSVGEPHTHDISPRDAILADIGGGDIHLNGLGYKALMKYCTEEFYGEWLDLPKALSSVPMPPAPPDPDRVAAKAGAVLASFRVTFSEEVTGVDAADFVAVTRGGRAGASILDVEPGPSGYHDTYVVTIDCGSGRGTVSVGVLDNGTIKDRDGNGLGGDIDGSFSGGEWYDPSAYTLPVSAWPAAALLVCLAAWAARRRGH
ncbi:MAG TPA: hypothetical protein PK967_14180 [Candidatus Hydrogenedentes bacterium]|nr:hypothetical protein [Candidatus Hydrogenedentota bacterium]